MIVISGRVREVVFYQEGRSWAQTERRMERTRITLLIANVYSV